MGDLLTQSEKQYSKLEAALSIGVSRKLLGRVWHLATILAVVVSVFSTLCVPRFVAALGSSQNPQSGSVGLEGTVAAPAPKQAATIATPGNGQSVASTPITIGGLCTTGLLVKVFSNNIFIGSAQCTNGSYSLQASLFSGDNDIVARVYDALDQSGPDSNQVIVHYNDSTLKTFVARVSLSSTYAKLGADPGTELVWPIILSGGTGPYAISVDWGDGKSPSLQSESFSGTIDIKHVYESAGVYNVVVKATDANGSVAFLQLVGVANGKVSQGTSGASGTSSSGGGSTGTSSSSTNSATGFGNAGKAAIVWWPSIVMIPLIGSTFWLGRRHELFALRKKLEQTRRDVRY